MTRHPDAYVLVIDAPGPFLVANGGHGNRYAKAELVKAWRAKAGWTARAARIPAITGFVRVTAFVNRGHSRSRWDPANWSPTAKACVDGIRDAGVLVDDDHRHVDGPDMRPGQVRPGRPSITIVIRRAEPEREEGSA